RQDRTEVAAEHSRGRDDCCRWRGSRPLAGGLVAGKEQQLVFDERSTESCTELIPLDRVIDRSGFGRHELDVMSVDNRIAEKFEDTAMKVVCSGFGNGIYRRAGMHSITSG